MAENQILPFAYGDGANVMSQGDYQSDNQRIIGHQPGIARSALANKAAHQAATIAAGVGQFMADRQTVNVTDDKTPAEIATMLANSISGDVKGLMAKSFGASAGWFQLPQIGEDPPLIIQWGVRFAGTTYDDNVSFPMAFPNKIFTVVVQGATEPSSNSVQALGINSYTNSHVRVLKYMLGANSLQYASQTWYYIAIGN